MSFSLYFSFSFSCYFCLFLACCIQKEERRKLSTEHRAQNPSPMSGLYNNNSSYFSSPARAASPQIRSTPPEIDRYTHTPFVFIARKKENTDLICFFLVSKQLSVLDGASRRTSKAYTFYSSLAYMQPPAESRFLL